jgi:hypothetical protein
MREFTFHDKARVYPGNRGTVLRVWFGREIKLLMTFFRSINKNYQLAHLNT